jgi:hypothetical protein
VPIGGEDVGPGEAGAPASKAGPAIIEVPEVEEDRAAHESMWAERQTAEGAGGWESRLQAPAGAPVAPGSGAEDREEDRRRRSDRAGESDSSLGDLFWGEE